MSDSYPIIEVQEESASESELMGSKKKFWYLREDEGELWLFKYPRRDTGEHWAEKVAEEAAELMEIPHARVELAEFAEEKGSVTASFLQGSQELVHGNQMLAITVGAYDPRITFRQSSHTLANIFEVIEEFFVKPDDAEKEKTRLAKYLVLDALIGNTDRHHENWGLLLERKGNRWVGFLAPSYDHASSLGRELQDTRQGKLLKENRIGDYAEKGRGAIYWAEEDRHGPSPLELVRRAARRHPDLFLPALEKVAKLRKGSLDELVNRVPHGWMSASERDFAISLMHYNFEQLQELIT